jgi:D-sedoheptulose 7-phosphate isomerase
MLQVAESTADTSAAEYLAQLAEVVGRIPTQAVGRAISVILQARATGRRIYVMGNGGSSATASHFVCDLVKTARVPDEEAVRAFSLSDNTPLLTAWSNDDAYEHVFSEYIRAVVEAEDVVIGISASGNSANILSGLEAATRLGARTIALVGFDGGGACQLADVVVHVPSHDYGLVEDSHAAITHAITRAIRMTLLVGKTGA